MRGEDINLWKECSENEVIRASEKCLRVVDGSCFDLRNLTESQEQEVWVEKVVQKGCQLSKEYSVLARSQYILCSALAIYLIYYFFGCKELFAASSTQNNRLGVPETKGEVISRREEGGNANSRIQEKELEIAFRERDVGRREKEITEKEEQLARKEKEMAERQKDEEFRVGKQVQAQLSLQIGPRVEEEVAFRAGKPWPPASTSKREEPEKIEAPRPETMTVGRKSSRKTAARR
ncbi:hypothetical protein TWF594_009174 [Orbilia oligospora]|uniref:Uncharacterized protein n=1 Tax=Orbilia oligospora TaxID=2813651 RepID=A0A7C8P1Q8_ORBOL|nr:hypothetical protein TWF706_010836 [Orbilia oligospora]KAF3147296.1 hypothetical protein TWF703_000137 [Orbilia oligospora]KAF3150530.1 hypothetical protein TWF594_009174 [Orbilia oligospora]